MQLDAGHLASYVSYSGMQGRRRRFAALVALLASLALAVPAAAGAALPVLYSGTAASLSAAANTNGSPPGANDFSCQPSAPHPYPVVLVHGTLENMAYNWNALSPLLKNNGYCVFAFNYGQEAGKVIGLPGANPPGGTAKIESSAGQLAGFVDEVLSATGAAKVDIVGHSQGGMMPRYYLKFLGGAPKVHDLVGLAPSNHGTTVDGLTTLLELTPGSVALDTVCGESCNQQLVGSNFLQNLNAGGDTVAGVNYTVIETRYDEVVTPYTSAFLSGPNVTNILLQKQCSLDLSEHISISFDHIALRDVLNALDPAHAKSAACTPVLPLEGG
jgi:triacylglycerol esterase/lipase EstA (alpha/beta hydrolase family)